MKPVYSIQSTNKPNTKTITMKNQLQKIQEGMKNFLLSVGTTNTTRAQQYTRKHELTFKWTISKGRDTYGYNICTLYVDGNKVASCNGGGYDMQGTCLGNWLANAYAERLYKMTTVKHSGLTFHNPAFNIMDETLKQSDGLFTEKEDEGKTFRQLKEEGKIVDLDMIRGYYSASSGLPTEKHVYPQIDGAVGMNSVQQMGESIGLTFEWEARSNRFKNYTFYTVYDFIK